MSKAKVFQTNDRIFAKVKGYPAWPACVTGPNDPKGARYKVYFYGTYETAIVKKEDMWFFDDSTKAKFGKQKRKGFSEAIEEIENRPEVGYLTKEALPFPDPHVGGARGDTTLGLQTSNLQPKTLYEGGARSLDNTTLGAHYARRITLILDEVSRMAKEMDIDSQFKNPLEAKSNWQVFDQEKHNANILTMVNTANLQMLQKIPAIGPKTAFMIHSHRELHGKFDSLDILKAIPGLQKSFFNKFTRTHQVVL